MHCHKHDIEHPGSDIIHCAHQAHFAAVYHLAQNKAAIAKFLQGEVHILLSNSLHKLGIL